MKIYKLNISITENNILGVITHKKSLKLKTSGQLNYKGKAKTSVRAMTHIIEKLVKNKYGYLNIEYRGMSSKLKVIRKIFKGKRNIRLKAINIKNKIAHNGCKSKRQPRY